MGGSNAAISQIEDVLGQLDWLTAELEAQRPFLKRIPEVQLTSHPLEDQQSLLGLYQQMLVRERDYLAALSVSDPAGAASSSAIDDILEAIISNRARLMEALRSLPGDDWHETMSHDDVTLLKWAYDITLEDGNTLRKVAERLHESQLSLGGKRPDGA